MPFSVSKKQKELNEQEKSRSSRIRTLLQQEPEAGKFFGEGKQYLPPQEKGGKFAPEFEQDREAVINKAILDNKKDVESKDYHKKRDLNPVGQGAAAGLTSDDARDPETKEAYRKIEAYRRKNK